MFAASRDCIYLVQCLLCHVVVFIRYRVYYIMRLHLYEVFGSIFNTYLVWHICKLYLLHSESSLYLLHVELTTWTLVVLVSIVSMIVSCRRINRIYSLILNIVIYLIIKKHIKMKYFISSLEFWSKNVTNILNKNIIFLFLKNRVYIICKIGQWCTSGSAFEIQSN